MSSYMNVSIVRRIYPLLALVFLLAAAPETFAEAFGNNSLHIPKLGMTFFDTPKLHQEKPWGIDYQWTFGTSFMQAINYRFWWTAETHLGFGKLTDSGQPNLAAFSGGAGVRYNIFEDDFRPHVDIGLHYVHFLGDGARYMPLNLGWPIFVGLKPTFGMEWLFYSEMALFIDGSYGIYININEPFRQMLHASCGFGLYF